MTYAFRERSGNSATPTEMFDFYRGGVHWRYTNADRELELFGERWKPIPISRSNLSSGPEVSKSKLKVEAPRTIEVYEQFRVAPPGSAIGCTVYSHHYGDDDVQAVPEWTGVVVACVRRDSKVTLHCEPAYSAMQAHGLRRKFQRQCPHVLYGPGCKVNKEEFKVIGTVDDLTATTMTCSAASAFPDFYFEGGFIEWYDNLDLLDQRSIEEHVGSSIRLAYTLKHIENGQEIALYPGCNHTMEMCNDVFDNILNYGGTPYIPEKNPYKGQPVF